VLLTPNDEIILFRMLASGLPDKIQCSNEKSKKYCLGVPKITAIKKYKFIQFAHPDKYQWLSIDIDSRSKFKNFDDILLFCGQNNVPEPTIILKSNKGWHIHWYLDEALWKNNKLLMSWRKEILHYLNGLFGGDKYAAGFIFRNPFKHEIVFKPNVYIINDFTHLVSLEKIKQSLKIKKVNKIKKLKKFVDFTSIKIGERNNTLFNYIRTFMFRNYELGLDVFHIEALRVNSLMPNPLSESEVRATVNSAYSFVKKHYNPDYKNKNQTEYNRKLAKYKAQKTYLKALTNLVDSLKENKFSFFKFVRNFYSLRKLAILAKVDPKTIKKYILKLKNDLLKIIKNKTQIMIDIVNFTFEYFIKQFSFLVNIEKNKIGVLRC
jgi:hypothetical protein